MDPDVPAYKATLTKTLFERVGELPVAERDAVLDAIPSEHVRAIERAGRTDWLPAEIEASLDRAIFERLGEERLTQYTYDYTSDAANVPIFAPILKGALNLFGGARGLLKLFPRTWGFVARNCGRVEYAAAADHVELAYLELPVVMRTKHFAAACEGSVRGGLALAGENDAELEVDTAGLHRGELRIRVVTGAATPERSTPG